MSDLTLLWRIYGWPGLVAKLARCFGHKDRWGNVVWLGRIRLFSLEYLYEVHGLPRLDTCDTVSSEVRE